MAGRRDDRAPRVSAIGAAYNYAHFLPHALESVLAQDYPELEVILVDDGSTDDTPRLVEPYLDRIRYVRKENGGVASAVNRGYEHATGEFVFVWSADDEMPPDRTRDQVAYLRSHPEAGIVYGDMAVIDQDGRVIQPSWLEMVGLPPGSRTLSRLVRGNCVPAGAMMIRASLAPSFLPIAEWTPFEDWWTLVHVAAVAEIHFLPGIAYRYRLHGGNMDFSVDRGRDARQLLADAQFRRMLVTGRLAGLAETDALLECQQQLVAMLANASAGYGAELPSAYGRDEAAAAVAREEATAAIRDRDLDGAIRAALRAGAFDPWSDESARTLRLARETAAARERGLPLETRGEIVAARAEALLAEPALFERFARRYDAGSDVTLVVLALPEEVDAVAAAAERARLTDDAAPDVLVTTDVDEQALAACASAALGPGWPLVQPLEE
jgi:hypothetical protein